MKNGDTSHFLKQLRFSKENPQAPQKIKATSNNPQFVTPAKAGVQ